MNIERLNAELISDLITTRGISRKFVIEKLELGSDGYKILRGETLPKDSDLRTEIVRKVANFFGVGVPQILLRLEAKRTA